ncbi:MAG TPA: UPF0182 family protein [Bryobacteraceae bacterium]|nr:UPF0182 family protein [Bryobacteraceae bacterium]
MAGPVKEIPGRTQHRGGCLLLAIAALVLIILGRSIASFVIDLEWWKEMGQLATYFSMLAYAVVPAAIATVISFPVFWVAHARALKFAGTGLAKHPLYAKISTLVLLLLSILIGMSTTDTWTVVRYFGGRNVGGQASAWHDPVFGQPLAFYLFELPFYSVLLHFVFAVVIVAAVLYWATGRGWQIRRSLPEMKLAGNFNLELNLGLSGALESWFLRLVGATFLLALAVYFFLGRYEMLLNDHGFMVGIDYTNQYFSLPLQWLVIAAAVIAAGGVLFGRFSFALAVVAALIIRGLVPPVVAAVYVRPNEITLEKPFIARHIEATRTAYALDRKMSEVEFQAQPQQTIDTTANRPLLDNVRLWDSEAFRAAVSQMQPLRPYVYESPDVDRYTLGGNLRQVLITPREMQLSQLGEASQSWINTHFMYTHGYAAVMAEANRASANGLPVLLIQNAPVEVSTPDLKITRPELYYGEIVHDPVFVRTAQQEFDYPAGAENVHNRYDGKGGFPISSLWTRTAAAISQGDWNILLTSNLTPESRMMIRRQITARLDALADFILWDNDPYIVLTKEGRLVWMIDGYMTSNAHPYSRTIQLSGAGSVNYIRNSIKATIDGYDGTVHFYVFDEEDPLVNAYRNLFPALFTPASEMPADLREHARYPELIFRVETEIYRTFHMRDPETFYNKSDAWDIAKFTTGQTSEAQQVAPAYIIATIPGEKQPEFLEMIPFTPRNRDNLIGLMMARCDGPHLGEKLVLLLTKQEIIRGPLQVEAFINQNQVISKDLTLWNQQGSQVLRGQMVVLPIQNTFMYVEPIYIQASQAKMPQLMKVVIAMGNTLIYTDTYQQALAQLVGQEVPPAAQPTSTTTTTSTQTNAAPDPRLAEIRQHFQRYKELAAQGKLSDAGKELEAIQALLK